MFGQSVSQSVSGRNYFLCTAARGWQGGGAGVARKGLAGAGAKIMRS